MSRTKSYIFLCVVVFAVLDNSILAADPVQGISFLRGKVDTSDLVSVAGLNIYRFNIDLPAGRAYRLVLRSFEAPSKQPTELHSFRFEKKSQGPVSLLVSFTRRDEKFAGVLLSSEKDAIYRIDCENCSPNAIATVVPMPLANENKVLFIHNSSEDLHRHDIGELRLITVVQHKLNDPPRTPKDFPRLELVLDPQVRPKN